MSDNNRNQQPMAHHHPNMTTPLISMEQFVQYQLRQEEIERQRVRDTMSNMIQTFFPNSNFNINAMLPITSGGGGGGEFDSLLRLPAPTTATTTGAAVPSSSSTLMPLPRRFSDQSTSGNNISKLISWANILSLECTEVENASRRPCGKKVATEEEMQKHLRESHHIQKYRCLDRNCTRSFDRRNLLEQHIATAHKGSSHCRACPNRQYSYTGTAGIERHYQIHHQKGLYQCIHCRTVKEYLADMNRHKNECSRNSANNYIEQRTLRSNSSATRSPVPNDHRSSTSTTANYHRHNTLRKSWKA